RRYTALATELGVAPSTLALAWCLRNPNVSSVILGASKVSQLLQNFEALDMGERIDEAAWKRVEDSLA
ncbi:MAG: aldo/keto reductase, partial [Pseudomonadota bacterium]